MAIPAVEPYHGLLGVAKPSNTASDLDDDPTSKGDPAMTFRPLRTWSITCLIGAMTIAGSATGYLLIQLKTGTAMTETAQTFLDALNDEQRGEAVIPFDDPSRLDWHFIPKDNRKGIPIGDLDADQREALDALLQAALSQIGFEKSTGVMKLEAILEEIQRRTGRSGTNRDPGRYFVTVFGDPTPDDRWGLSFEGHHLSLNFVVEGDEVVSSSPQFFGANPVRVTADYGDAFLSKDTRVLDSEEDLAFALVNALDPDQLARCRIAEQAPRDVRGGGQAQPDRTPAVGLPNSAMTSEQKRLLRQLIQLYIQTVPDDVAQQRIAKIRRGGADEIHFAWAGALEPGIGHYYRIQGPNFLIEFVNTQPDSLGNLANHSHSIWRDLDGDFGIAFDAE